MLSRTEGSPDSAGGPVGTWGRLGCEMPRDSAFVCEALESVLQPPPLPQNIERKTEKERRRERSGLGCFRRASLCL